MQLQSQQPFKNKHQKDMCFKKIGLRAQNLLTILGSVGPMWPPYGSTLVDFDNS